MNKPKTITLYSSNDEEFEHEDYREALDAYLNQVEESTKVGAIHTLYVADFVSTKASDFIPCMNEYLSERAYDELGEYTEDWLENVSDKQRSDLQKAISVLVDTWAKNTDNEPRFYRISGDSKEVKVRVTEWCEETLSVDCELI